jgi:L-aminopeptidase/D-esterase-like protein
VATNAVLTKTEMTKIAQMAQDGLARTINPVHTAVDGDTVFAAATGSANVKADFTMIGSIAAEVMARAINNAVLAATRIPGYPACRDLPHA